MLIPVCFFRLVCKLYLFINILWNLNVMKYFNAILACLYVTWKLCNQMMLIECKMFYSLWSCSWDSFFYCVLCERNLYEFINTSLGCLLWLLFYLCRSKSSTSSLYFISFLFKFLQTKIAEMRRVAEILVSHGLHLVNIVELTIAWIFS